MDSENRSLTLQGLTIPHMLYVVLSIGMMIVSIYLTKHFYNMNFPEGIGAPSAICNISGFWNCDTAVFSSISSIFNIPIAFFGLMLSVFFILGSIFPSRNFEMTSSILARVNAIGCIILMIYSVVILKSLCPLCTIFYILSWVVCFIFIKHGVVLKDVDLKGVVKVLSFAAIPFVAGGIYLGFYYHSETARIEKMSDNVVEEFLGLPIVGDPIVDNSFRLASATHDFSKAPLRVSIFSDFECPYCSKMAKQFAMFIKKYEGKLNMQFIFYPLDQSCNSSVERKMHQSACKASYIAVCANDSKKANFAKIHDYIFDNQAEISHKWLNDLADKYDLKECADRPSVKDIVVKHIAVGKNYYVQGTPTIILNGAKVDAGLPSSQWIALFDGLLKKAQSEQK